MGLFVLAYHNGSPFSPVGIDEHGGEPLLRELISPPISRWMSTNFTVEICTSG